MQIVIQARGFDLTAGLRERIERRLCFSLDWAHDHVSRISVVLSDVNGPRGGEDKRCHIQVAVPGTADVLVDDTQADLYMAIDRSIDRAGRTLARRLARQRQHRHGSRRDMLSAANSPAADDAAPAVAQG
ncbi:putative sigma 54 modulation protein/ribosomal protein S30EA [Candidatus Accumulibacter aalborgensis]|uniref:Putative sigma 54 modulation protein/ribosomal protein S30EA n=1 Tax=Candidatus Accumulibacter aalborgensis TaxID=1860102 RepID=A0A1A8XXM3_9PROT|nr:HPF/RaiA family ribosome-associated protein [Candidatus Accumulibacter aalborgensis]SBT09397.1 putative sigma 54 modulation protein/ribosomal protein S30EA [Candidatus Accumulibacter aalborgensis]